MSAVAVTVGVGAVGEVGAPGGAALEVAVRGIDTSVDDIDGGTGAALEVVVVFGQVWGDGTLGDATDTPGGIVLDADGVGVDIGVLLDVCDLWGLLDLLRDCQLSVLRPVCCEDYLNSALVKLSGVTLQLRELVLVDDTLERGVIAASETLVVLRLSPSLVGLDARLRDVILENDDVTIGDRFADLPSNTEGGLLPLRNSNHSGESSGKEGGGLEEVLHLEDGQKTGGR